MTDKKNILIRAAVALILAGLSALLAALAKGNPAGVARVFGPWSRSVSAFLARVFSFTKVSVFEIVLWLMLLLCLVSLVRAVVRVVRRRSVGPLLRWVSFAALTASCFLFVFLTVWGLNYFNPPLAERLERRAEARSAQQLYDTAVWVRDEMNRLASQVPRDDDGVCDAGGFDVLAPRAALGYNALAAQDGAFASDPAPPKRLLISSLMARFGLAGIYIPFTCEAVVDCDSLDAHLPFTICHELAHRMGYAPEDEANYIAFLACTAHPDAAYQYAGWHLAFIYCSNALGRADSELSRQLWAEVSPPASADMRAQNERLKAYEGPLQEAGEAVNNTYLQAVGQEEGVKSYGLVVDLLIAEYEARFGG